MGDNVIPFPSRAEETSGAEPEYMDAIDAILGFVPDPSTYTSPLVTDLSMVTVVALLRSAAGEPHVLGPPDSAAGIGPEPSHEELAAAGSTMVATLTDLALGKPMKWPGAPDARTAVDVIHALSLAGGALAEPAGNAMAEHGLQPSPHMVHFDTAEVTAAYLVTYPHGEAFELLFELRYPHLADEMPRPAYMVNLGVFDGPTATAVHGAEDIGDLLETLATMERSIDPAGPQVHHEPVDVADALATLDNGLARFDTTIGAAADANGAEVGNQRMFMDGLLRRAPVEWQEVGRILGPGPSEPIPRNPRPATAKATLTAPDENEPLTRHHAPATGAGGATPTEALPDQILEPFDVTGIPEQLRPRTEAIVEQASHLALTVFDDEFVTLVRHFAAACAREPECPFGRGRLDLWASGVVYAVAQLNDIPGGWGRLSMDAEDLTDELPGARSTIVAKARDLRRLLGLERHDADPEFLHSSTGEIFFGSSGLLAPMRSNLGQDDSSGGGGFGRPAAVRPTGVSANRSTADRPGVEACFVLYVSLVGSKPAIWRRLRVPVDASFADLHRVLQLAFGWLDYHLHDFDVDGYRVGVPMEEEFGLDCDADEATTTLGRLLGPGDQVLYTYDYGDGWEHGIVVEELQLDGASREHGAWAVLDGAMAGPPEDCGGMWGYRELLEARNDRRHPRHAEIVDWLPAGFDPTRFDLHTVNQAVRNHRR